MTGYWSQKSKFLLRNGPKFQCEIFGLCDSLLMGLVKISSGILLCILGELAGVGSLAVAVGVSELLHVTCDTCFVTCDS